MRALLLIAAAQLASAQFVLYTASGAPVGSTFSLGSVAAGSNDDVKFSIRPAGSSAVTINTITISGAGFAILSVNGTLPSPATTALPLDFTVRFNASLPANYNASLAINGSSVSILTATAVTPPVITAVTGCTITNNSFDFGNVTIGAQHFCNFTLFNPSPQPMTISTLAVSAPFSFQANPATPIALAPNTGTAFAVVVAPACGMSSISGTLTVNTQVIPLIAAAITPSLPAATFTFDSNQFASNQQRSISIALASPLVCPAAGGNLTLSFTPAANVQADSSVSFVVPLATSLPFTVTAGSSLVTINGHPTATFNTGTTAGSITFKLTGTSSTTIVIPPAPISIESATASNQRLGALDISVTGFDNTYSAGSMSFAFFDASGNQIGSSISADFSSQFKSYFASQSAGSSFLMRVSFPVTGDQTKIATVKATLTNSAGATPTGTLTFH